MDLKVFKHAGVNLSDIGSVTRRHGERISGSDSGAGVGAAYRHELDICEPLLKRVIFTLHHAKKGFLQLRRHGAGAAAAD